MNRNLATPFDGVAGTEEKKETSNSNSNIDVVGDIIKKKSRKETHDFRGYYLENEVIKAIDKADKSSGTKSEIVNDILKHYFKQHGYMK